MTELRPAFYHCPMQQKIALPDSAELLVFWKQLRDFFSFRYNDEPYNRKVYYANAFWFKWLYEYYFKIQHRGATRALKQITHKEKVIVISNHANTLEALSIYYYFYLEKMDMIRAMVFKEAFRLPFFRELFRSGRAVPISIDAGAKALKKDHLLIFPEGLDFVRRYLDPKANFRFHSGFLRIAENFLTETKKDHVTIVPVAHEGFDEALKFWVIQNPLVKMILKPTLGYPYAVWPKLPVLMPARIVYVWGKPIRLKRSQLNSEAKILRWKKHFETHIANLQQQAKQLHREIYP